MEDEQDDVQKITDFINKQKANYQTNFQWEFHEFLSYKVEISDHELDDDEDEEQDEESIDIKDFNIAETPTQVAYTTLTEEERSVIESCTDPDLKKLLVLNRSKNMQLVNLHKKLQDLLTSCEQELEEQRQFLKNLESKQINQPTFIWKLAAPYFKDKKFFSCPLNEDTAKKRVREELTIYELVPPPKWTPIEFDRLISAVRCNYSTNRQNEIVHKISALKAEARDNDNDDKVINEEIVDLQQQLERVKNDDSIPPQNSNEFINWYKVAETFLKDKHTASECQSVWHMLVHPDINKSEWTDEENNNLEAIAKRHSYQNWDDIAEELNTQRTGFITCLHYFSKLCDRFKKKKFTPEEDKFLIEVVDSYKKGSFIPWNKVVCHFSHRSRHQLYHRYTYFLTQNHVKKGKFTEAEDILLMVLVDRFGRNFKKCSEHVPNRSQMQLKSRYNSNLKRLIRKGTFTREDDKIIFDYVQKHGTKSWVGLTEKLNRCGAQIRQRYKTIKTFLAANPEASLSDIPRRKHRFDAVNNDEHYDQYNFLKYMADQYTESDYIPTLSMIEESLQVELRTSSPSKPSTSKNNIPDTNKKKIQVKNIDSMLTDFFSSSMKLQQPTSDTSDMNVVEACSNVEEMLAILGANLSIPEDFESNLHLDNIDVEILYKISNKKSINNEFKVDKLIPPNISTLVGLRSLIIKNKDYKMQQKNPSASKAVKLIWPIEQNLVKLDEQTRKEVLLHRDLFTKRFDSLFSWSAILSLEKPNHIDIPGDSNSSEEPVVPVRSYRRKSIEHSVTPKVKRLKVDVAALASLSKSSINNAQLQFVDKSVVEKLMQNNSNVSIIRIETRKGSDGVVRPMLPQSDQTLVSGSQTNSVATLNNEFAQSDQTFVSESQTNSVATPINEFAQSEDDVIEDVVVEDEDVEDVQKLDVILKSEVVNDASACTNEEYQAIKGDVQLLKEILQYEKIKIESEPDSF